MANVIHFFEYLEYEDLEKLDIVYKEPIKGDNQTYISYLENPVQFYLPKSEIIDIYQDVLQPLNLHCPTCSCETEINLYEDVVEKREQYLEKLKEVLGKSD